jgi:hypothetical protein
MNALDPADRARHALLVSELASAAPAVEELAEGFAFRFPSRPYLFLRIAEWIGLERQCCPFLAIRLDVEHASRTLKVSVSGPAGAKELLRAELPLAAGSAP